MMNSSEWQTPAAVTLRRTCPGPGSGVSISTSSGPAPIVRYCRAFMGHLSRVGGCLRNVSLGRSAGARPLVPPAPLGATVVAGAGGVPAALWRRTGTTVEIVDRLAATRLPTL